MNKQGLDKKKATFFVVWQPRELFGLLSLQNNNNNPQFKGRHIQKKVDKGNETCDYESDHIFLLRDSTMPSALNFCFISPLLHPREKDDIRRKTNSKKKNVYM